MQSTTSITISDEITLKDGSKFEYEKVSSIEDSGINFEIEYGSILIEWNRIKIEDIKNLNAEEKFLKATQKIKPLELEINKKDIPITPKVESKALPQSNNHPPVPSQKKLSDNYEPPIYQGTSVKEAEDKVRKEIERKFEEDQKAKGLVNYYGKWITVQELEKIYKTKPALVVVNQPSKSVSRSSNGSSVGLVFLFIIIGGIVYFLPSIAASDKKNNSGVFILNLFFGWTLLGWVLALIWAVSKEKKEDRRPCPFCKESIKPQALICPHCRQNLKKSISQKEAYKDI